MATTMRAASEVVAARPFACIRVVAAPAPHARHRLHRAAGRDHGASGASVRAAPCAQAPCYTPRMVHEIDCVDLAHMLTAGERVLLVDVRHPWEHAIAALPGSVLIPLPELATRAGEVAEHVGATDASLVVTYCHHGVRSLHAAAILGRAGHRVASLAGGIDRWSIEVDSSLPRY